MFLVVETLLYAALAQSYGPVLRSYLNNIHPLPNGKYDMNNGGLLSTDCAGCSWGYPDATYEERRRIYAVHVTYRRIPLRPTTQIGSNSLTVWVADREG